MKSILLLLLITNIAAAQSPVQIEVGLRTGVHFSGSFQDQSGNPTCTSLCATSSFSSGGSNATIGPTVGVLFRDHFEIRFEAVQRRFNYQRQQTSIFVSTSESINGHLWEYPILATYRFGSGMLRPFVGGGLGIGVYETYRNNLQSSGAGIVSGGPAIAPSAAVIFTNSLDRVPGVPLYIVSGVDWRRTGYLSIRPEFRYSHYTPDSSSVVALKPNQFEFLVGLSLRPFRRDALVKSRPGSLLATPADPPPGRGCNTYCG